MCLLASESARAHGTITPAETAAGSTGRFVIGIPNDSLNVVLNGFRLTPPPEVAIESVETADDWTATHEGPTVVWSGGSVAGGETASFAFTARLPSADGVITFQGEEIYVGFSNTGTFPLNVTLTGSMGSDDVADKGSGASTAVAAAAGALLILLLAFLLGRAWRERRASRRRP